MPLPMRDAIPVSLETSVNVPSPLLRYSVLCSEAYTFGMAVSANTALHVTERILVDFPHAIVHDEQVQLSVVVVIEPACADRPHFLAVHLGAGESRLCGYVGKRAVAVVVKQLIAGYVGKEDVGATIVVVVADRDAHAVARPSDSRAFRSRR